MVLGVNINVAINNFSESGSSNIVNDLQNFLCVLLPVSGLENPYSSRSSTASNDDKNLTILLGHHQVSFFAAIDYQPGINPKMQDHKLSQRDI